jgi:hypothetical protein
VSVVSVPIPGRDDPLVIDDERWTEHRHWLDETHVVPPARRAYGALHVVMHDAYDAAPHTPDHPGAAAEIAEAIDWDGTMALRRRLADLGLGIAEAMDTAQRFELGWDSARRLIEETGRLRPAAGFVAGAGTDHLRSVRGVEDLVDGVVEQATLIRDAGGIPIILPMAWLAAQGLDAAGYVSVYRSIIDALDGPLLVHWLGPMFAPALEGYFPGDSFDRVMRLDPDKVRGAKLSMLDADLEVRIRRDLLERDQIMLTGDDFNFPRLIEGASAHARDRTRLGTEEIPIGDFSHALLGIIDGIAAPFEIALRLLAHGRTDAYRAIMEPCATLGRIVFEPPTDRYKVGLAFLAWLDGLQPNPMLVNHLERERSREHLLRVAEAAAAAGAFTNAPTAGRRLTAWLESA